ncbi:MFS transporter [Aestuariispira insulae]|uniref:Fucose permease n=1 Tax=Aestuariispira insulae TaxID=1461337 RepID=A0A3D9HKL0_9PROT|nr:MFS transporter [Aestuariispira insulae]RED49955.1 fucose permease [Aestuariispira insulae]
MGNKRLIFDITILYGAGMFAAMQLGLFSPMVPALQQAFQADKSAIALASSLITGAGAICGTFAGAWIARAGYKQALIIGSILLILGTVGLSTAPSLEILYLCRFLSGFGYLVVVTACPGMMCALVSGPALHLVMGIWGTFVPVGVALGAWLAGAMIEDHGWQPVILASILPSTLCMIGLLFLRRENGDSKPARADTAIGPVLRNAPALYISLAFALFAGGTQAVALFLPSALIELSSWQVIDAATLMGLGSIIGGCIGSVTAGALMARGWSGPTLFSGALILLGMTSVSLLSGPGPALAIAATGLFFFGQGVVGGAGFALLPAVAAQGLSMAIIQGLFTQFNEFSAVTLPPLMGATIDQFSWHGAAWFTVVILAGSLFAILRFSRSITGSARRASA